MISCDDKTLELLQECGKCQLDRNKIATLLEVPIEQVDDCMNNPDSKIYKAYNKGRLLAEFEVRKSIYNLAVQGSSQAQELYKKLMDELKVDEA